jgi:hypothetical protein
MVATIMILLVAIIAWLWWRLSCANDLNAELRDKLAKLRRRMQARG